MDDLRQIRLGPRDRAFPLEVGGSEVGPRKAIARARVMMARETTSLIAQNAINKGDVLATARVAGIQAAKRTSELLPMCHQVTIGNVYVNFTIGETFVEIESYVDTVDRTGVEMEALTAASVAALTIYDMCKSSDRTMTIEHVALWEKSGGRAGSWRREDSTPDD